MDLISGTAGAMIGLTGAIAGNAGGGGSGFLWIIVGTVGFRACAEPGSIKGEATSPDGWITGKEAIS